MNEHQIQQRIRQAVGNEGIRLWRNNVGALRDERGQLVRYGLCPGSSDLIGLRSVLITEEHVGHMFAVFCAIEVKGPRGSPTEQQEKFLSVVSAMGGLAGIARSEDDARRILRI